MKKLMIFISAITVFSLIYIGKCYSPDDIQKEKEVRKKKQVVKRQTKNNKKFPLRHAELRWSKKAPNKMNYIDAKSYCKNLGGRLPTISELRTLIQNCPKTETDGPCGVADNCLHGDSCWNKACGGCSTDKSGEYSVFGDTETFWSSSVLPGNTDSTWYVGFGNGYVSIGSRSYGSYVRCVR